MKLNEKQTEAALPPADKQTGAPDGGILSTGNEELDFTLGGGLSPNCFILVEDDPGVGKKNLALEFELEGVRQGERVRHLTLSEGAEELRIVAKSYGFHLEGVNLVDLSPGGETLSADNTIMFQPSEVELNELTEAIISTFDEYGPQRVVIDTVRELRHLSQSDLRYSRQLIALTTLSSVPNNGCIRRRLQVSKMHGQKVRTGLHDFTIKSGGLAIYPRLVAAEHRDDFKHGAVSGGVSELDELLGGGLQRGTSTLTVSAAGTGKSFLTANDAVTATDQLGNLRLR